MTHTVRFCNYAFAKFKTSRILTYPFTHSLIHSLTHSLTHKILQNKLAFNPNTATPRSLTHSLTHSLPQTHEVSRSQRRFCVLQLACSACKFPGWSVCDRDSCLDLRNTLHGEQYTTISLQDRDGQELRVNVVMEGADGSVLHMRLFIYVSFWVINRTGIHLLYAEAKKVVSGWGRDWAFTKCEESIPIRTNCITTIRTRFKTLREDTSPLC